MVPKKLVRTHSNRTKTLNTLLEGTYKKKILRIKKTKLLYNERDQIKEKANSDGPFDKNKKTDGSHC